MLSVSTEFMHITPKGTNTNATDQYAVFYAAWGTNTYLHVINTTSNIAVCSHRFTANNNETNHKLVYTNAVIPPVAAPSGPYSYASTNAPTATTSVKGYPNSVYQVSSSGYFDVSNGYLVLTNPGNAGQVLQYDRTGGTVGGTTVAASVPPTKEFIAWTVVQGPDLFVYMAFETDTLVFLVRNSGASTAPKYEFVRVYRYNKTGMVIDDAATTTNKSENIYGEIAPLLKSWLQQQLLQTGGAAAPPAAAAVATTSTTTTTSPSPSPGAAAPAAATPATVGDDYVVVPKTMLLPDTPISDPIAAAASAAAAADVAAKAAATTAATTAAATSDTSSATSGKLSSGSGTMGSVSSSFKSGKSGDEDDDGRLRKRATVQGINTHSAFGAMLNNPSNFRPMPASISLF